MKEQLLVMDLGLVQLLLIQMFKQLNIWQRMVTNYLKKKLGWNQPFYSNKMRIRIFVIEYLQNKQVTIQMMANQLNLLLLVLFFTTLGISKSNCQLDCCRTLSDRLPMTYIFYQNTGRFIGGSGEYFIDSHGYSGRDKGYLNPDEQCTPGDIGPLPATTYKLSYCKNYMHQTTPRPCSFYLDPQIPQQMCSRVDFFIHGCQCCTSSDDTQPPVNGCSQGCIVLNYDNRRKLKLGDTLIVKHYEPKSIDSNQMII